MRLWHLLVAVAGVAVALGLIRSGPIGWFALLEVGAIVLWKFVPIAVRWMNRVEAESEPAPMAVRAVMVYISGLAVFAFMALAGLWIMTALVVLVLGIVFTIIVLIGTAMRFL